MGQLRDFKGHMDYLANNPLDYLRDVKSKFHRGFAVSPLCAQYLVGNWQLLQWRIKYD